MKSYLIIMSALVILSNPIATQASQEAQKLGVCLTDSMNGKERKNLAKWIYFGMSAHSIIKPYSNVPKKDIENSNKYVADLITRLLTVDCPKQAQLAFKKDGSRGFKYAFGVVGKVAMQELMAEPTVSQSLGAFEKYLDQEKFNQVFKK